MDGPVELPQSPDRLQVPPSFVSIGCRGFSSGIKRQGREADLSPPSSTEVKKGGVIPTLPLMSSCRGA
jgi:hypothetical protein